MNEQNPLDHLIRSLASLPGLGHRSARRIALHLLAKDGKEMHKLANVMQQAATQVKECNTCANLDTTQPCRICQSHKRDKSQLCIVAEVSDIWAIERTNVYSGLYHILGGTLSALDGIGPQQLRIGHLQNRLSQENTFNEIILALPATVDGQSTAHYVSDILEDFPHIKITRLAHGMPVGGQLDYLDEGTIITALKSRNAA